MKKQRLLIIMALCLILCCSVLLSACSGGTVNDAKQISIMDIIADDASKPNLSYSQISSAPLSGEFVSGGGNFFYTTDTKTTATVYTVYNIETLSSVYSYTDTIGDNYSLNSIYFEDGYDFFTVNLYLDGEYETRLIDRNGNVIATKDYRASIESNSTLFKNYGYFTFGGDLYEQSKDGALSLLKEKSAGVTSFRNIIAYGKNYFWASADSSSTLSRIAAYDLSLNPVAEYVFPGYSEERSAFALSDDCLFIQYIVPVDPQIVEYDIIQDGEKYNLFQFVYNTEKKEITAVEVGGIVDACVSLDALANDGADAPYVAFDEEAEGSIALILPIVDKYVDSNNSVCCTLGSNGLVSEIIAPLPGAYGANTVNVQILDEDRYLYYNHLAGAYQIVDKDGEIYGSFASYDSVNDSFILVDRAIYNFDFQKIYELGDTDRVTFAQRSVYIKSYTSDYYYNFYLLKSGDTSVGMPMFSYTADNNTYHDTSFSANIGNDENLSEYVFAVRTYNLNGTVYEYYNSSNGQRIGNYLRALTFCASSEDGKTLLCYIVNDGITYYYAIR